jgi:acetyl-CoA carboxylase carboxyltransferase component
VRCRSCIEGSTSRSGPWPASERGLVDQVIDPADTRIVLCSVLSQLGTKREMLTGRKHDAGPQ